MVDIERKRKYNREQYHKNKEKILEDKKKYYESNKEHLKKKSRDRYQDTREEQKKYQKTYTQNNSEKIRIAKEIYYKDHKEEILNKCKVYNKTIEGKITNIKRRHKRRASIQNNGVYVLSVKFFNKHFNQLFCSYCGGALTDRHLDHIIPVSRGGTHSEGNLITVCPTCNLKKSGKFLIEYKNQIRSV